MHQTNACECGRFMDTNLFLNQSKKQSNVFALRCFCVASFWQRNAQTLRCYMDVVFKKIRIMLYSKTSIINKYTENTG